MTILQEQINEARVHVHTDSYPMSIGELVNLYEDGELDIHPEFQRVYRWTDEQKSKLIESILLGIPLPSIFVAQRSDGIWDVVDGLQRLSTILSFQGKLRDERNNLCDPLTLSATKYLPGLKGMKWDSPDDLDHEIDIEVKRIFKREKIDIKIIKKESEGDTKFELFQRLNTGGTKLSDQEVRNCMLLMVNNQAYYWLKDLSTYPDFNMSLPLTEKQEEESYGLELAFRYIVHRHNNDDIKKAHTDVGPYLDAELNAIFKVGSEFDYASERVIFHKTFSLLASALGDDAFKKFNHNKEKYEGAISLPVFEAISFGVSKAVELNLFNDTDLIDKIKENTKSLTSNDRFIQILDRRVRPLDRMVSMNQLGMELFS
ncbi:DUF262 domain-containing protein [Citrobacter enshiensis]|uniref:DUF262 domain-containing protein n=1 Tax=Citrobacter enshiensis TaxID=2971264 RepID=UPI0023E7DEFC|nr:DUF262 domain-containing protein [Citrobacter enshiensis]WET40732.1 DUF262 domain-containing protein [Citrobacter enshiensis]